MEDYIMLIIYYFSVIHSVKTTVVSEIKDIKTVMKKIAASHKY